MKPVHPYLGVELWMTPLLVCSPVAGVLVGLGTVATLVRPEALVHVSVTYQSVLVRKPLLAGLTSVRQVSPEGVVTQYMA